MTVRIPDANRHLIVESFLLIRNPSTLDCRGSHDVASGSRLVRAVVGAGDTAGLRRNAGGAAPVQRAASRPTISRENTILLSPDNLSKFLRSAIVKREEEVLPAPVGNTTVVDFVG
jgi:hypothetical protein